MQESHFLPPRKGEGAQENGFLEESMCIMSRGRFNALSKEAFALSWNFSASCCFLWEQPKVSEPITLPIYPPGTPRPLPQPFSRHIHHLCGWSGRQTRSPDLLPLSYLPKPFWMIFPPDLPRTISLSLDHRQTTSRSRFCSGQRGFPPVKTTPQTLFVLGTSRLRRAGGDTTEAVSKFPLGNWRKVGVRSLGSGAERELIRADLSCFDTDELTGVC